MKQSKLFYKTFKEISGKEAPSHKLLVKAGFVDQLTAGVYTFLPLGFRVLKKIEEIIREEMVKAPVSGQEMLMPALNPKENWQKTGRWDDFNVLFKLKGANAKEYALGPTHEEVISPLAKKIILSYKDLPFYVFQIQTKFRNELRAKSGLLRTREFLMKDLYSFHSSQEDLDKYYEKVGQAYLRIFQRCGIGKVTYQTWASGGTFSKFSHEYQTVTKSGEDIIYVCQKCKIAVNKSLKMKSCPNCKSSGLEQKKAVEVGNIFKLGTKYSSFFNLKFKDKDGKEKEVIMGCYGIGLPRVMAAIVEISNDKNGIIWPEQVAPFQFHLIQIGEKVRKQAKKIYKDLQNKNIEVLYDDRENKTAGEKFAEADLIGIPYRIVVSERTLGKDSVEIKKRDEEKTELVKITNLNIFIRKLC